MNSNSDPGPNLKFATTQQLVDEIADRIEEETLLLIHEDGPHNFKLYARGSYIKQVGVLRLASEERMRSFNSADIEVEDE